MSQQISQQNGLFRQAKLPHKAVLPQEDLNKKKVPTLVRQDACLSEKTRDVEEENSQHNLGKEAGHHVELH